MITDPVVDWQLAKRRSKLESFVVLEKKRKRKRK